MKKAAMLWTGGKDSSMAMYEAQKAGYEIKCLVTFVPPSPKFLAHPIEFIKSQSKAMEIPHVMFEIVKPYKKNYQKTIQSIKMKFGIDTLVTGDIAEVNQEPNWIRECCRDLGIKVYNPLWGKNRAELIGKLLENNFQIIFSLVKKPWFTDKWVGRRIDKKSLEDLRLLNQKNGLDISGENGEYHTLSLDGPIFKKHIQIENFSKESKKEMMYLIIKKLSVV